MTFKEMFFDSHGSDECTKNLDGSYSYRKSEKPQNDLNIKSYNNISHKKSDYDIQEINREMGYTPPEFFNGKYDEFKMILSTGKEYVLEDVGIEDVIKQLKIDFPNWSDENINKIASQKGRYRNIFEFEYNINE